MKPVYKTDVLQSTTKNGESKFWQGIIVCEGKRYFHQSRTWRTTKKGKSKEMFSEPYEVHATNVGRANEMNPEKQAQAEMASMFQKKLDKGYAREGEKADVLPQPMLAHKYRDDSDKIHFPCFIQPKLDGNRRLYDGKKSWSRGGKLFLDKVVGHLHFNTFGHIIDGEIMLPVGQLVQESNKAIKKAREESAQLCYYVYDIMDGVLTFQERNIVLKNVMKQCKNPNIIYVPTVQVNSDEEIFAQHQKWVKEGYEGTIIRNADGLYEFGHRSHDLQKLKDFFDEEYKVIDIIEAEGGHKGCAIFVCVTKNKKEFKATPVGELTKQRDLFANRKKHIGKWVTVKFYSKTADGAPFHGNAIGFRDEKEF